MFAACEEDLGRWRETVTGAGYGRRCCARLEIDMQLPNGRVRCPTAYRCKPEAHVRADNRYEYVDVLFASLISYFVQSLLNVRLHLSDR